MDDKIETLLKQMTLEEKVSLTAGTSMWYTAGVERLGIPAIKVTDGPNGARGGSFFGGPTSACFPVGVALAATWNPALVERVGMALAEEAKTKGAHVLLAPTVNIHRSPLSGRNFECYSEDPYLSARLAVAYVKGVQSQNVGATIKHFVCNDQEFERNTISSEVRERALREIYLPPFKAAVEEAGVWSVMASYNKVNGTFASENSYTLQDILKGEWGFEGLVMSDWFGTKSTVDAANNGLDLEMPGPPAWRGDKLLQAVKDGRVSEAAIDDMVRRLLRIVTKVSATENTEEQAIDRPEHRALIREAAAEGIVLLKNERDVLPLDENKIKKLAIIGPNAKVARIQGGGSAQVTPHYAITPFDGITARAGDSIEIGYELGCTNYKMTPLIDPAHLVAPDPERKQGLVVEYFDNLDLSGEPVAQEAQDRTEIMWIGELPSPINRDTFSARITGTFTPEETGIYTFGLSSAGPSRLFVDDQQVIDNWTAWTPGGEAFMGAGSPERTVEIEMRAGQPYQLRLEYSKQQTTFLAGVRLGCLPPIPEDAIERAVALAAQSDVALIFAGLSHEWESEGFDRPDMELPDDQVELIRKVAAANENTVVVLNTGSPVAMDWLDRVAGVVQAWYPGQECGNSIADVLFGDVNPSGRLPLTFPRRLEDNPAYINYPGEDGKVYYGEGIFVGYRYYDKKKIEPLFPFGHGLSYTTFEYRNLSISPSQAESPEGIKVTVDVQNTGTRAGEEVVQLYVRDPDTSVVRPEKELKAFHKVMLEPGETKTVEFTLGHDALAYYDTGQRGWFAEAGEYEVLIGHSSRDIRARGSFTLVNPSLVSQASGAGLTCLSASSTLRELLASEEAKAILERHLPGFTSAPQLGMAMGFSLEQISSFAPDRLPPETVQLINEELAQLAPVDTSNIEPPRLSIWQRLTMRLVSALSRRSSDAS